MTAQKWAPPPYSEAGGAVLGVLLAPAVAQALISFLPEAAGYSSDVNPRLFLFALGVALVTGFLFGLAPALQLSRAQPGPTLKQESSAVAGGLGLRKLLVVGQITLAMVLLIGSGLFVRPLANLKAQGPGSELQRHPRLRRAPAGICAPEGRIRVPWRLGTTLSARECTAARL